MSNPRSRPDALANLSRAIGDLFREFTGKGPESCKSHWAGDDALVTILKGGYSVAERTLFAAGRGNAVQESRFALQETMAEKLIALVEGTTGRKVIAFMSASHQEPDYSGEIFILAPAAAKEPRPGPGEG